MFFNSWYGLLRIVIVGILAYTALVLLLRISGKRTLSKMNAFDLVVTVALGSTLATILLSQDVALLDGIAALITLIALQYLLAWLSVRSVTVSRLIKAEPALLFYQGSFLQERMKKERVTREEVLSAIRAQGIASLQSVLAVVLETDGSFTVLEGEMGGKEESALQGVSGSPAEG